MSNVSKGEEKFFGLIADDPHPDFDNERQWIVSALTYCCFFTIVCVLSVADRRAYACNLSKRRSLV